MKQIYALSFLCVLLFSSPSFAQPALKYWDALAFDGTNDRVVVQPDAAFDFATGTVEAWVYPKVFTGQNEMIAGNRDNGKTRYSIHMNATAVGLWNGSSYRWVNLITAFQVNTWYHIAAVIGTNSTRFYVNGLYVGTTRNGMGTETGLPIFIGHPADSLPEKFNGNIDEVKFWNTLRADADIINDMRDTSGTASSLVAYYKFSEGSGTQTADATGHGRNGVLYDFSYTGDTSNWVRNYTIGTPVATDATSVTSAAFTANWQAPANDTVSRYLIDISRDSDFTDLLPGYAGLDVGNVLSYSITGLTYTQPYYYRVRAIKDGAAMISAYSNSIEVTLTRPVLKFFVDASATQGLNNGSNWSNAYVKLEDALTAASYNDTIWVAKGTYQPAANASFVLSSYLNVYGGFAGTETALSQRVLTTANATILKGSGSHIIACYYTGGAELDGFTIADGYYTANNFPNMQAFQGLGIYNYRSVYTIRNCIFRNNKFNPAGIPGNYQGAAMFNQESYPVIINCIFENNTSGSGGAITNNASGIQVINSVFTGNSSQNAGGAIENVSGSQVAATGCIFYNNSTASAGSVLYNYSNSDASFVNCTMVNNLNASTSVQKDMIQSSGQSTSSISNSIITGNDGGIRYINAPKTTISYSILNFSYTGTSVTAGDPMFTNIGNPAGADGIWETSDDGFELKTGSPAINKGSNDAISATAITTDITGGARIQKDTVDIGSYEYVESVLPVILASFRAVGNGCNVQISWKAAQEVSIDKYTVEKSVDGIHFTPVADVKAKNVSGATYAYTYSSNNESRLYFKLQITDKNGKTDYGSIEQVSLSCRQVHIAMTPNPVKNVLLVSNLSGTSYIQVYNASGQQVITVRTSSSNQPIDIAAMSDGIYIVRVMSNNKLVSAQKIMKY